MIKVKIWKWWKLLNYVPFIKKTLVTHLFISVWSFWLTFTVSQWMKNNLKIYQFSCFLLRSRYAILGKIWKCLKLLNSFPFIKKTLLNHVYIQIWSFRRDYSEWRQTSKLVNFQDFCWGPSMRFRSKFENY